MSFKIVRKQYVLNRAITYDFLVGNRKMRISLDLGLYQKEMLCQ